MQDVLATALVESGLLDVEFEGNEGDIYERFGLKTMYNIAKTAYQKNPQTFKNIGKAVIGAGAVDTLNQDAVSGKRNMFLRVGLSKLKNLEPVGIFSQNLAECLKNQLIENKQFNQHFEILLENLNILPSGKFKQISKLCKVSEEKLFQMKTKYVEFN